MISPGTFINFWRYKPLLFQLVSRDLKTKYRRSILGHLWSLLNPLMMMIVISSVFSYVFRNDIKNYPIYLIIGQVTWNFFSEATNASMNSLIDASSLLKKVYIPKYIFPLSKVFSTFINMMFSFGAIAVVLIATNTKVTPTITLLPVCMAYLLLFSIGMGLILSVITVYFRDMLHLYGIVLMAWMYLTPIFYSINSLSGTMQTLLKLNPMYSYVTYMREIILYGTIPSVTENLACLLLGALSVALGLLIFWKKQDGIILYL